MEDDTVFIRDDSESAAGVRYRIDPETLHDTADDPDRLASWLDARLRDATPTDPDAERQHRTRIGLAARTLRRLDVAEQQLARALELAQRHGTPAQAVLARVRHAHVLQWQGRFDEATAEFDRCIAEAPVTGERAHFVYQHAGKCAYDLGDWPTALEHFTTALGLRTELGTGLGTGHDAAELIASSSLAVDAADACATAAAVAVELHRLVPGGHAALRPHSAPLVAPAQPNVAVLINSRTLLLAGPAPLPAIRAIHRYHLDHFDDALRGLVDRDWLVVDADTVCATERCVSLLTSLMSLMDKVFTDLWGEPTAPLSTVDTLVAAGRGTSQGDAFDPLASAGHPMRTGTTAGRLFTALCTIRYHRADAHAFAWTSEGLTADGVRALDGDDPQRRRIEATTDRIASRPYRTLSAQHRADLIAALRQLPAPPA